MTLMCLMGDLDFIVLITWSIPNGVVYSKSLTDYSADVLFSYIIII